MSTRARLTVPFALPLLALLMAANPGPPDLSDAEVAHVAVTANSIDAELGRLALERGEAEEVKRFAETMVSVHTSVNEQAGALAEKLGVTPQANDVSRSLRKEATEVRERLEKLSGSAFDAAYIDREIAYHEAVIDAVENVLIPTTENEELKGFLQDVLPAFHGHLEMAKQARKALAS